MSSWKSYIFDEELDLREKALRIFQYQYNENPVYQRFCDALVKSAVNVRDIHQIPLYPVRGFKETEIVSGNGVEECELTFRSSGTSDMTRSVHHVKEADLYRESVLRGIRRYYPLDEMVVLGYAPGYEENDESSLIWMIQTLIEQDKSGLSRFLPVDQPIDPKILEKVEQEGKKVLLFGAAFGLLDYLEQFSSIELPDGSIVMETGGMKTHRREISRGQMHRKLAKGFGVDRLQVHSEYGMTEMLSQAYARGGKWFTPVPWLKVVAVDPENPGRVLDDHELGRLGIIDLANVHSLSFLLTGDWGKVREDGRFQVRGRWNPDNLRGCNFLVDRE